MQTEKEKKKQTRTRDRERELQVKATNKTKSQHRKYSSQTMFFRCASLGPLIRLLLLLLLFFCPCRQHRCSALLLTFVFVDAHFLASLSFLILQIYVRIAHFMFSSYFFFNVTLAVLTVSIAVLLLLLLIHVGSPGHGKLLLNLTFFVKNVKYFCAFQRKQAQQTAVFGQAPRSLSFFRSKLNVFRSNKNYLPNQTPENWTEKKAHSQPHDDGTSCTYT